MAKPLPNSYIWVQQLNAISNKPDACILLLQRTMYNPNTHRHLCNRAFSHTGSASTFLIKKHCRFDASPLAMLWRILHIGCDAAQSELEQCGPLVGGHISSNRSLQGQKNQLTPKIYFLVKLINFTALSCACQTK